MPKVRKRKVKPKVRTIKGVSQVVKININQPKSVRRRSYLKPNPTQGNNLMVPQLISTRQEPFDLRLLGNLQERVNKLDNLSAGLYDRDFALEMENQDREKKKEKEDGILQEKSVTPALATRKRGPPFKKPIQEAIPFTDLNDLNATRQLDEALGITAVPELKPRGRSSTTKTKKEEMKKEVAERRQMREADLEAKQLRELERRDEQIELARRRERVNPYL